MLNVENMDIYMYIGPNRMYKYRCSSPTIPNIWATMLLTSKGAFTRGVKDSKVESPNTMLAI